MKSLRKPRHTTAALLTLICLAACVGFISGVFSHRQQSFPYRQLAQMIGRQTTAPDYVYRPPEYDYQATLQCMDQLSDSSAKPLARVLVVGHAYGPVGGTNSGVDTRLVEFLSSSGERWDLMAMTGDIVSNATRHNLRLARNQLSPYARQLSVAPGNHDVGTTSDNALRDIFEEVFGPTYSAVVFTDALLVFVDLSVGWTLDSEQRNWLQDLLTNSDMYSQIIVFSHQLVWAEHVGADLAPNSFDGLVGEPDFAALLDLFQGVSVPIMFVAGDVGVGKNPGLYCGTRDGVHFIASGLGKESDYLIELTVLEHGGLSVYPIELGSQLQKPSSQNN